MSRILTYVEAIREAIDQSMERDKSIFALGLGADGPNGSDGTTDGLVKKYPGRVFDTPCSEYSTTGFCTGAALIGMRPIIYHGRVEFALFAYDQLVTQAAKWNYMFGGDSPVPAVYRIAVGRRWGDAPQHTSVMHSAFAHVPGLQVIIPSTPRSAKGALITAIRDNNPVVFLEHRWLYSMKETVPEAYYRFRYETSWIVKKGKDMTIVAIGDMVAEALRCVKILEKHGIDIEIIDPVRINPLDCETILKSVRKTGRLIVADVDNKSYGIGSEIISRICEEALDSLWETRVFPVNIATPDCPCPMATTLTEAYYPTADTIIDAVAKMFNIEIKHGKRTDFWKLHMPSDENIDSLSREI